MARAWRDLNVASKLGMSETLQSSRGPESVHVESDGLEHAESPFVDWKVPKRNIYVEMVVGTERLRIHGKLMGL